MVTNNQQYVVVPSTGQYLYDDTIVMLSRFPGTKWIVKCGWYKYNGTMCSGWYFAQIPYNTVIPVTDADLESAIVVSTNSTQHHPHPPVPPAPPSPYRPGGCDCTAEDDMLERAMITVDSIAQRDALNSPFLPDGKVVRVNDSDGAVAYFEWDSTNLAWKEAVLGDNYMTREETKQYVYESLKSLDGGGIEWSTLP